MIRGLIIGHGAVGEGLESAITSITGSCDGVAFLSNAGRSTADIAEEVRVFAENTDCSDGLILFVDLFGGSCWQGAKLAGITGSYIVTGVNLPMLLSFLNKRDTITLDDLPNTIFQRSETSFKKSASGLQEQVEALEIRLIQEALLRCGGNQSKAARQLEITERKLRYKLQKYKLD